MEPFNDEPNFSILLPGGCNAKCSFCFNNDQPTVTTAGLPQYLADLKQILAALGPKFFQISLTGGEPTLSPYFDFVLGAIAPLKNKYTNIILTTNGTRLLKNIDLIATTVDHINISRHHYDEAENDTIMGGTYHMDDVALAGIIDECGKRGMDVSANCVINDTTDPAFIGKYIQWAKGMGVEAVRFRKENGTLDPTPAENAYNHYKVISSGSCPVCRSRSQRILGMSVSWNSAIVEPSTAIKDSVYELVFMPDANIYSDWKCGNRLVYNAPTHQFREHMGASDVKLVDHAPAAPKPAKRTRRVSIPTTSELRHRIASGCGGVPTLATPSSSCGGASPIYHSCGSYYTGGCH